MYIISISVSIAILEEIAPSLKLFSILGTNKLISQILFKSFSPYFVMLIHFVPLILAFSIHLITSFDFPEYDIEIATSSLLPVFYLHNLII